MVCAASCAPATCSRASCTSRSTSSRRRRRRTSTSSAAIRSNCRRCPNTLDELQLQVADIAKKLDKIPFDEIGENLNSSLKNAEQPLQAARHASRAARPATRWRAAQQDLRLTAQATLQQDSPLQSDVHQALQELTRTLQSLNALSDYLERHPESLLRGKSGDKP